MDRDWNAAKNIYVSGMRHLGMACPEVKPLDMEPLYQNNDESSVVESGSKTVCEYTDTYKVDKGYLSTHKFIIIVVRY